MQPQVNQYTPYNQPNMQTPQANKGVVQGQQAGQAYAPPATPQQPTASVGAVQIYINNPTVSAGGYQQPTVNNNLAGQPVKDQFVPATNPVQAVPPQPKVEQQPVQPKEDNIAAQNINPENQNKTEEATNNKAQETAKEKKPVIPLTDEYIKTLENYIKNENPDIRFMGIKELLKRFKEDDTRKTDQALTNLLNYALQDDNQKIRLYGLMILDAGYARGDDYTYQLLTQMQKSDKVFNQDAMTASQILLKRAGDNNLEYDKAVKDAKAAEQQKQKEQVAAQKSQVDNQQPQVGQKLNFLAG